MPNSKNAYRFFGVLFSFLVLLFFWDERHVIASGIQALATVPAGGTGLTTLTAHGVLIGNGTSPVNLAGPGTAGQCFLSNGALADPTYQACPGSGGGGITVFSGSSLTVTANTYYFPIGGGATPSTTETNVDIEAPSAATITNFYVQMSVAFGMGNTGVFTWRKAGVSQSVTCTISGAAATTCNDTTHSFTVAQGDLIDVQLVTTGTIAVAPNIVMAVQFGTTGSNGTVNNCASSNQAAYYASSGTAISCEQLLSNSNYYGGLGSSYVITDESTTSPTFVGLTTADTVTFTLAATTTVNVLFSSVCYLASGSVNSITWEFNLDTVDQGANSVAITNNNFNFSCQMGQRFTSLSAGSHTIIMKYKTGAGTAHWFNRDMQVTATP